MEIPGQISAEIDKSYLNEEGQVSDLAVEGIAIVRYKYDALGRQIERVLFDKNMNAVNAKNSGRGIVRTRYAVGSLLLSESSFDKNGQPVDRLDEHWSTKEWEYDQERNVKKITLIDKYGKELH
jgi:YD repeat-containing protein